MALSPVQSCLFDVKAKNLCQFEKFVFTITTKGLTCSIYGECGKNDTVYFLIKEPRPVDLGL
jgi:hypothetical protein